MFKILVVDDEKSIREVIRTYAEFEGHEVVEASDGLEAIDKVREENFDVIVMDIMMPKLDGFSSYKEIKKIKDIPVLMLSARGEEYDKLFGFEIGIDDYVTKPFSPKELMARLNVIVNRNNKIEENNTMEFEGLKIDLDGRVVFVDDEIVDLTPKEYDLLVYMVKNKNIALSRDKLLNQVWGYDFYGEDRTVDTHIKMLRNSIKKYRKFIITVRGVGYKFDTRN
ncbi:response regulator transcription factor [Peptoniphilus sp. AGMB00490]|uniref:Response regulator transcription factor n=2 Tax=Peptoniphilus TaxID=162289 RepID=A0ACD6AYN7_9FIRM|nr:MULTISPECIES: response regulator transcription factor [Peptoniphilus]NMW84869.1 response regulator transcription factor [Peptoniphilus faecalis]OLR64100.1 DNA-binding response regulator [Peptoniphilus porci]